MDIEKFTALLEKLNILQVYSLYAMAQVRFLELQGDESVDQEYLDRPINATNGDCKRAIKYLRIQQSTMSEPDRTWCNQAIRYIRKEWMGKEEHLWHAQNLE